MDFGVAAMGPPMTTSPFIAGLAKFVAVGTLMAGGAGGIYFVSRTNEDSGDRQVVAETPTVSSAETATPTPEPLPGTPEPATLTDTGYTAPDGRPLYAECMQPGAPLPPEFPEAIGTVAPEPTPDPSIDPNVGKATPSPSDLPPFDPRTIAPADTTGWVVRRSACYGYSLAIPPGWEGQFSQAGYQQGEGATLFSPNRLAKVDVTVNYTPVDQFTGTFSGQPNEYLLERLQITRDGRLGFVLYVHESGGLANVRLTYFYQYSPDHYVGLGVTLFAPYDANLASQARALAESLRFK